MRWIADIKMKVKKIRFRSRLYYATPAITALLVVGGINLFNHLHPKEKQVGAANPINSAHRMIVWETCQDVIKMTDAQLTNWANNGVGGFACMNQWLYAHGGSQDFTGNANADLSGAQFQTQRGLRDSNIIARAKQRGLKVYI